MPSRSVGMALLIATSLTLVAGCGYQKSDPSTVNRTQTVHMLGTIVDTPTINTTPTTATMTSIRWKVSGHKEETPTGIRFALTVGNHALVAMSVPHVAPIWYQYIALTRPQKGWDPRGIFDAPMAGPMSSKSQGLGLPFSTFRDVHGSPYPGVSYWIFEHHKQDVIVMRIRQSPISLKGWRHIAGTAQYVKSSPHSEDVLEGDEGYWIAVGGNVSLTQCQHIFNSLPQATSGTFPFSHPDGPTTTIK